MKFNLALPEILRLLVFMRPLAPKKLNHSLINTMAFEALLTQVPRNSLDGLRNACVRRLYELDLRVRNAISAAGEPAREEQDR